MSECERVNGRVAAAPHGHKQQFALRSRWAAHSRGRPRGSIRRTFCHAAAAARWVGSSTATPTR